MWASEYLYMLYSRYRVGHCDGSVKFEFNYKLFYKKT